MGLVIFLAIYYKFSFLFVINQTSEAPGVIRASAAAYLGLAWRAMLPR